MSNSIEVFRPAAADTRSIAATTTTANVQIVIGTLSTRPELNCRVYNSGTSVCMIEFGGTSAVTATDPSGSTAGSLPIAPGAVENFRIPYQPLWVAAKVIAAGTSGTIYFTPGFGI